MINDRGINKKWHAALLLPEHVKLHQKWKEEMAYQQKPELDEQKLEEMDLLIHEAMEYTLSVSITYFKNHQHQKINGHIHFYDPLTNAIKLVTLKGNVLALRLYDLVDIQKDQEE